MDNFITLAGNITRDPELRYTQGGSGVVSFGLAVNRSWKNRKTDEWEEETHFFQITAWQDLAENAAASLTKGARVVVQGRLQTREYENREGVTVKTTEVTADEIAASLKRATVEIARTERTSAPKPQKAAEPLPDEEPF